MTRFKLPLIAATIFSASMLTLPAIAKTLVYCSDGSPEGFDPALYTSETTLDASSLLYDRLVEIKPGETEVQPGLAQSWSASEDGLEHTFNLRSSVKFQKRDYFEPTRDFNADDVVFSFERQLKEDNPWHEYAKGKSWEYFNALSMQDVIKEIEKVDDFTVKFILNKADTTFLYNLTMDFASIVSKEYAESLEEEGDMEDFDSKPVGTGPYRLVASNKDKIVRYRVHPEYWDEKKEMHSIVYVIFPDAEERLEKMELKQCHTMSYPKVEDLEKIRSNEELTLFEEQGLNVVYLAYNTELPPFDKPEVRIALNMAIDRQAILDEVFGGDGQIAKSPLPPTMWSYNEEIENVAFDPDAAKDALEAADVGDISMTLLLKQGQESYQRIAEMIQSDFEDIGVSLEIIKGTEKDDMSSTESDADDASDMTENETGDSESESSDNAVEDSSESEEASEENTKETVEMEEPVHAILHKWDDKNGDPDNFLFVLLGCDGVDAFNYANWCHQDFDTRIKEAKTATDQEVRSESYKEAQKIFKEQAPWATLVHSPFQVPMSNLIVDYTIDPRGKHSFINTNFYEEPEEEIEEAEIAPIEIDLGELNTGSESEDTEAVQSIETTIESTDDTTVEVEPVIVNGETGGTEGEDAVTADENSETEDTESVNSSTEQSVETTNESVEDTSGEAETGSTDSETEEVPEEKPADNSGN